MPPSAATEASGPPPSAHSGDTLTTGDTFASPDLGIQRSRIKPRHRPTTPSPPDADFAPPPRASRIKPRQRPATDEERHLHVVTAADADDSGSALVDDTASNDTATPKRGRHLHVVDTPGDSANARTEPHRRHKKRRIRGTTKAVVPLPGAEATSTVGNSNETTALPTVPEPPATEAVSAVSAPATEVSRAISAEQARKLDEESPAKPYDLLHHAPDAEGSPYETMQTGWLRATVGRAGRRAFNAAVGAIGLDKVLERAENRPSGGYPETQAMPPVEGEVTAEVSRSDTEGPATAESDLARPIPDDGGQPVFSASGQDGEPSGPETGEFTPTSSGNKKNEITDTWWKLWGDLHVNTALGDVPAAIQSAELVLANNDNSWLAVRSVANDLLDMSSPEAIDYVAALAEKVQPQNDEQAQSLQDLKEQVGQAREALDAALHADTEPMDRIPLEGTQELASIEPAPTTGFDRSHRTAALNLTDMDRYIRNGDANALLGWARDELTQGVTPSELEVVASALLRYPTPESVLFISDVAEHLTPSTPAELKAQRDIQNLANRATLKLNQSRTQPARVE